MEKEETRYKELRINIYAVMPGSLKPDYNRLLMIFI